MFVDVRSMQCECAQSSSFFLIIIIIIIIKPSTLNHQSTHFLRFAPTKKKRPGHMRPRSRSLGWPWFLRIRLWLIQIKGHSSAANGSQKNHRKNINSLAQIIALPETNSKAPENRLLEVWGFLLETTIFRGYVSFQACIIFKVGHPKGERIIFQPSIAKLLFFHLPRFFETAANVPSFSPPFGFFLSKDF